MNKKQIRETIKRKRDLLTKEEILSKSGLIMDKLVSMEAYKEAETVMCFSSFGSEVNTFPLTRQILKDGKTLVLPRVENKGDYKKLGLYTVHNIDDDLTKGVFGILEPDIIKCKAAIAEEIDLFICPGVVFDLRCNRIGYGGGYYDRLFAELTNTAYKVGIAFDLQIVEKIEADSFDIPLDFVITEKRKISRLEYK